MHSILKPMKRYRSFAHDISDDGAIVENTLILHLLRGLPAAHMAFLEIVCPAMKMASGGLKVSRSNGRRAEYVINGISQMRPNHPLISVSNNRTDEDKEGFTGA